MSSDDEVVKVKRQTYKPKTLEEMAIFLDTLKTCIEKMREAMFKNKKDSTFPENAPQQNEFKALKREMDVLLKAYKHACQPKTRTKNEDEDESKKDNIGFNRREYILPDMVDFINEHKIDDEQPDIPKVTSDGRGIFTRALLTSYWSNYIENNNLKHETQRRYIVPDEAMDGLFTEKIKKEAEAAHKLKIKNGKKKKTQKKPADLFVTLRVSGQDPDTGEDIEVDMEGFDFATLQMLLTLFVDKTLAVIDATEKQEKKIEELREYFAQKTTTTRERKKAELKEQKEKEKAKKKAEKEKAKKKSTNGGKKALPKKKN